MKHIILLLALLAFPLMAGEDGPDDWEYVNFEYSANIQDGGGAESATIVGPAFPEGIRVLRDFRSLEDFKADLIVIVDALTLSGEAPSKQRSRRSQRRSGKS